MLIAEAPSPNFGPRKGDGKVRLLILHYTDTSSAFEALKLMQDPAHQASAHYLVDEDGAVQRLVPENMRAWHAGQSWWEGETDVNSASIGIEIQNPGHSGGYRPFPEMQIAAVAELSRDIMARHGILPSHVLAHSDIAPARKLDPGELFPWRRLAAVQVGLWPQATERDELDADQIVDSDEQVKALLVRFGYDSRLDLKTLVTAFQRHFEQDVFQASEKIGIPTLNTVKILCALQRQKLALRKKIA